MQSQNKPIQKQTSVGKYLKEVRISKNLSLKDVSDNTKIRVESLKDIENDDFKNFLSDGYAKANTYTYSRFLEVDLDIERINQIGTKKSLNQKEPQKKYKLKPTRMIFLSGNFIWFFPIVLLIALLSVLTCSFYQNDMTQKRDLKKQKSSIEQDLPVNESKTSEQTLSQTIEKNMNLGSTDLVTKYIYDNDNPLDKHNFANLKP